MLRKCTGVDTVPVVRSGLSVSLISCTEPYVSSLASNACLHHETYFQDNPELNGSINPKAWVYLFKESALQIIQATWTVKNNNHKFINSTG